MEIIINGFIGAASAFSFWIWCGSPNAETGDYYEDMLLSAIGKWLLVQWHQTHKKIFKLFVCPYCLAVWIAFFISIINQSFMNSIIASFCTTPFVALFLLIYNSYANR